MTSSSSTSARGEILVWDLPVRVFHWLLVLGFAGAWLTAESERWRLVHVTLGWTVGGLVVFRLLWGLVGTRHARFASFVRGPGAALAYLRGLWRRDAAAPPSVGHNPAGALAIVGLLGLALAAVGSGWAAWSGLGGEWLEESHEALAHAMLILVAVHVAGVAVGSLAHRENLVRSMFDGRKVGPAAEAIARPWRSVAVLMIATVAGFWAWQWANRPAALPDPAQHASQGSTQLAVQGRHGRHGADGRHGHRDDDD